MNAPGQDENDPFDWFGSVHAINLDEDPERWNRAVDRYEAIGIETMVRRYSAVPTPESHHIGCALSWRGLVELAREEGRPRFLGLEDDAVFHSDIRELLPAATRMLDGLDWDLFFLGCFSAPPQDSETVLQTLRVATTTHAVAVNGTAYERILADVPADQADMGPFIQRYLAIDQYFSALIHSGELRAYAAIPHLVSQPPLLGSGDADLDIAAHFRI
jgi:hypothetical protein